jgi:Skp family chaperone for outer membrane proteins
LTLGLLASGLAGLVGRAFGQQGRDDTPSAPAPDATAANPASALLIGTVRMGAIFKGYQKVAKMSEAFKGDVMARKRELTRIMERAQREADTMAGLTPGTAAHGDCQARIAKLKAEHEELRKKSEAEFTRQEAEMLLTLYKEIQWAIGVIAQQRGLTLVFRHEDEPIDPKISAESDPTKAMSAIERWVVFASPKLDITREVVTKLNRGE